MNKEEKEEINDLYEQLLDEYKNYKEDMTTTSKTRKAFAMDVHEKMKQEQVEKILKELNDIVTKINDDTESSRNKTKLHERFFDLIEDFNEINESSYGGGKTRRGKTKRCKTKRCKTRRGKTRRCKTKRCKTRRCKTKRCKTKRCKTRRCKTKRSLRKIKNTSGS
jgi:hypothetical protein